MKLQSLLSTTALVAASFAFATPGAAQTTGTQNEQDQAENEGAQPGDDPEEDEVSNQSEVEIESGQATGDEDDQGERVTVTGTRIQRPNLTAPVPITSVGQAELANQGQANVGDSLNDLPSIRSTFSQQNSGRFIGTAGLNPLDLRGLGIARTLVLVNNRRHVTASAGDFIVDVNTIPQDLIERVDIVTGGSSAVYGSDAIAGVVNFVLKRDFDGLRLRGQAGISDEGDRGIQFVTFTGGRNFADGRGNVAINLEYTNADPLEFRDRAEFGSFSGTCGFIGVEDTTGEPAVGNGIPDTEFVCGLRAGASSQGGTIGGLGGGRFLRFDPQGNLFVDTSTRTFPNSNTVVGGIGNTGRLAGQLAVGLDRYSANLLTHFDVTEAFKPFLEAKYVRLDVQQEGTPSFIQGNTATFFGNNFGLAVPALRCDNAFLSQQARDTLFANGLCRTTVNGVAVFNPNGVFPLTRSNNDFGTRRENNRRETYRVVAGIEGDFNDDWSYEISGNYGRFESRSRQLNNLQLADVNGVPTGFATAIDAVRDANGNVVCRVNADLNPNNDQPNCVPINLFGEGAPSQAALDFVNTTSVLTENADQYNALAFVNGDLSQLFEFPGGPIGFVVGAEYRREEAFATQDELGRSGGTFFNAFDVFDPPALEVKEFFGELNVPILRDLRGAEELTLSGAARYSDYNTSADKTFAYNVSGIYAPTPDIRFRANYSKAVRVPTLSDLFSPQTQNFAFLADPCNQANINGGPVPGRRAANCAALGVPTTILPGSESDCAPLGNAPVGRRVGDPFFNCRAANANTGFLSGGNPNLKEETGKSLTVGAVITPRFIPGFSLTVDYFDIEVEDLIAALSAQQIITACVDAEDDIDNPFCDQLIAGRDQLGFFLNPLLFSGGVNFAAQVSRGIDFDATYRRTFDNGVRFNLRGVATYLLERTNFTNPLDPTFGNRIKSELGDPTFTGVVSSSLGFGNLDLSYALRYIGRQTIGLFEEQNTFQGRPPTNADVFPRIYYPDVFYHDAGIAYKVNNNFRAYFRVDNIFDRKPPLGLTGAGEGSGIFSSIGRYFYAGAQIDF